MRNIKNNPIRPTRRGLVLALAVTVLSSYVARAVPYASCITNNAGTISYILNQNAQDVKVIFDGGGAGNTNALGAQTRGVHSFSLGGHTTYAIQVSHNDAAAWVKISDETNYNILRFYSPRGVAVNTSTTNFGAFGRIYVANASPGIGGVTTAPTTSQRTTGRGLYALNPDYSDPYGQGTNVRNAGISFDTSGLTSRGANSPWRLAMGKDGKLYICDYSTNTGTLYRTDPDLTASEQVLAGQGIAGNPSVHTTIGNVIVRGTSADGDLTIYAGNGWNPFYNRIQRYDIGAGSLPWNSPPSAALGCPGICDVNNVVGDADLAPSGRLYICENRSAGTDADSIRVFDTDGTTLLWGSRTQLGSPDPLRISRSVKVSPDGKFLAIITDNNDIRILPLDVNTGLPVYSLMTTLWGTNLFSGSVTVGRDAAFDAAGNIYAVSSGMEKLVIVSPGGSTVAITSFDGTSGSFQMVKLFPDVTVTAPQPNAPEGGDPGLFTISRTGDTTPTLTVNYTLTGTATNGVDYTNLATSVVIPAGASSANVYVQAVGDALAEPTETAILTLTASANYTVGAPNSATVNIVDTNTPVLSISALSPSMYERITNDYATVSIARSLGNTNVLVVLSDPGVFTFGGTAVMNVDYLVNSNLFPIYIYPGDRLNLVNLISPIDNSLLDGNRTVVLSIPSGMDFNGQSWVGATNLATTTIIDDEVPTETVLWSDSFNVDSATNYIVKFGACNSIDDYSASFAFDYLANYNVPAAPHSSGDTLGLLLNVNKIEGTALGAAGLNLYPTGKTFSGNYALRFDMYLFEGSTSGTTEYSSFGINHDGAHTNWFRGTANGYTNSSYDGVWDVVESDASDNWAYLMFTAPTNNNAGIWMPTIRASQTRTAFPQVFKSPPYGVTGAPANLVAPSSPQVPTWTDVELAQVGNLVTLRINHTLIYQYSNTVAATSGNIMLGYDDAYDSIGNSPGVIYDNVRVVQLFPPTIVTQPIANVVTPAGSATNLAVVVTGSTTGFTNYQWYRNGVALAGATNATLAFSNPQPVNDGVYTVGITDGVYPVTSTPSTVLVLPVGVVIGTGTGLLGGYWTAHTNTAPYTGSPTLTRLDSSVNFDWVTGSPGPAISADYFTARWVGQVQALGTETYTFTTVSDDGARLWVNGQLVVDAWVPQSATPRSGTIALTGANKYDIVMEYFEQTGNASAQLYWSNATTVGYSPVPQSQLYPAASVSPAIALTSPANGASYTAPATIPLAASVTTNNNLIQYVGFYNGATLIANVTNSPYQYSWSSVTAGSYNLSAKVFYNTNWTIVSATNSVSVIALNAPAISGITGNSLNYSGGVGSQFVLLKTADLSLPRSAWTRDQTNTATSGSFPIPVGSEARAFYTIKSE